MLGVKPLAIEEVMHLTPTRFEDHRGYFQETFNSVSFAEATGRSEIFVQDNESLSVAAGTVRGLHYQLDPSAQGKLVRVTSGAILDVAVDIRRSSPTYGQHVAVELSASAGDQLWIPPGFAHGFCSLEPATVLNYKVTGLYDAAADRSLHWADPNLAIEWPSIADVDLMTDKDRNAKTLAELEGDDSVFE